MRLLLIKLLDPFRHLVHLRISNSLDSRIGVPVLLVEIAAMGASLDDPHRQLIRAFQRTARSLVRTHRRGSPGVVLPVRKHEACGVGSEPASGVFVYIFDGLAFGETVAGAKKVGALKAVVIDVEKAGDERGFTRRRSGLPPFEPKMICLAYVAVYQKTGRVLNTF